MTVMGTMQLDVMLVDDNQADVLLAEEAVALSGEPVRLRFARDGQHALEVLQMPGSVLPQLLLLDVNMPRMTGLELLRHLKADPVLRRIPVVMLTTSRAQGDIDQAYDLGANAFVTKPVDLSEFLELMAEVLRFWGVLAALPSRRTI